MLHAVIMAGGAGTRFWPASRSHCPKQLLSLAGDETMIQATLRRLEHLVPPERALVVTNQRLVEAIRQQLPQLPPDAVIGEPCKRDTAPCIGLAAAWVTRDDPDAVMVVMPADHVISTDDQFCQAIEHAAALVQDDPARLVTFGIQPTYPAESFGYIERAHPLDSPRASAIPTFLVKQFREKPTAEVAGAYLDAGNFYWNSGIFVWSARTILRQLELHEPKMFAHLMTIADAIGRSDFDQVLARQFEAIEGRSIDYAVMEKAKEVVVVEAPFSWDDLGSWQSLARLRGTDQDGNTIVGKHLGVGTRGTIVRGEDDHLIVTIGLEDCIVVHTKDATLVANKHCEEQVREIVKALEQREWKQYL
jgi:mannose-1-phosphate guanylyltransferase